MTSAGRGITDPESRESLDLVANTANCGSTERTANSGFGEWEYLVSMDVVAAAVVAAVAAASADWVSALVVADSAVGVEVFDKATSAMD